MWSRILGTIVVFAAGAAACAPAMSAPQAGAPGPCRIVDAGKLPAEAGGGDAICSAIAQAIAARAPDVRYSAEVRVLSKSSIAVNVAIGARKLAEQHYSVMDRNLNPASIKRFAQALADEVAEAAKHG